MIWAPPARHGTGRSVARVQPQRPVGVAFLPDQPALADIGTGGVHE